VAGAITGAALTAGYITANTAKTDIIDFISRPLTLTLCATVYHIFDKKSTKNMGCPMF
jgi:hypothetical protein